MGHFWHNSAENAHRPQLLSYFLSFWRDLYWRDFFVNHPPVLPSPLWHVASQESSKSWLPVSEKDAKQDTTTAGQWCLGNANAKLPKGVCARVLWSDLNLNQHASYVGFLWYILVHDGWMVRFGDSCQMFLFRTLTVAGCLKDGRSSFFGCRSYIHDLEILWILHGRTSARFHGHIRRVFDQEKAKVFTIPTVIQADTRKFMKQSPKTDKTHFEVDGKASAYLFDQNSFKPYLKLLEGTSVHPHSAALVGTGCWFYQFQPLLSRWLELVLKLSWMSTMDFNSPFWWYHTYNGHLRGSSPQIPPDEAHMDRCSSQHCVSECPTRRDHQDEERRVQHLGGTRQRRSGIDMFEQCFPSDWSQSRQYSISFLKVPWTMKVALWLFEYVSVKKWCKPFSRY